MPTGNASREAQRPKNSADEIDPAVEARLISFATEVLGDEAMARRWLRTPILALGEVTPLAFAARRGGVAEVEAVLGRIAYGGYS